MPRSPSLSALPALVLVASAACARVPAPKVATTPPASFIDGPTGRLHVDDGGTGDGIPILFVHGLGGEVGVWTEQLAHLRRSRRAVALDLRGHGGSALSPAGDYSIDGYAADVAAVVDRLDLRPVILVGHSMGGLVIAAYAERHPDRVAGLLFDDSVGDATRAPRQEIDAWLAQFDPAHCEASVEKWFGEMLASAEPAVRDHVLAAMRRMRCDVIATSVRGIATYSPTAVLAAVRAPMLAVVTPQNTEPFSLQNVVPGMRSRQIEGSSHWIQMERADEFNGILDEFIAEVSAAASR